MQDHLWQAGLIAAGILHFVTLAGACGTPIPPHWDANLEQLPLIHRRFARAQNFTVGAVIVVLGLFSLLFAPEMVHGAPLARAVCLVTAVFWGGRLCVLPWLQAHTCLTTSALKAGFTLLVMECAIYAVAYAWLAFRPAH